MGLHDILRIRAATKPCAEVTVPHRKADGEAYNGHGPCETTITTGCVADDDHVRCCIKGEWLVLTIEEAGEFRKALLMAESRAMTNRTVMIARGMVKTGDV